MTTPAPTAASLRIAEALIHAAETENPNERGKDWTRECAKQKIAGIIDDAGMRDAVEILGQYLDLDTPYRDIDRKARALLAKLTQQHG